MKGRGIALLALIQMTAIGYGILLSAVACKLGKVGLETGLPMPGGYLWGVWFRDYGCWLMVPLLSWTLWAAVRTSTDRADELSWRRILGSGIGMIAAFFVLGTISAFGGITPLIHLQP